MELLGYSETKPLNVWLQDMWEWAKVQPMRKQYIWDKYEINKGAIDYFEINKFYILIGKTKKQGICLVFFLIYHKRFNFSIPE